VGRLAKRAVLGGVCGFGVVGALLLSATAAGLGEQRSAAAEASLQTRGCKMNAIVTSRAWARPWGLDQLSGNGVIYVRLARWPASRLDNGSLLHKLPWLFQDVLIGGGHPQFSVHGADGNQVGTLSSPDTPVTRGNAVLMRTSLVVPRVGCYRITVRIGRKVFVATQHVY
jgi:hypothetical protein